MFRALLFITARSGSNPTKCLTEAWINKIWCIPTRKFYSTKKKKKNEVVIHATTWMNLEKTVH